MSAFNTRASRITPIAAELRSMARSGKLTVPLEVLTGSYTHMHANRILRSRQRAQELALYDYLTRLYRSEIARKER